VKREAESVEQRRPRYNGPMDEPTSRVSDHDRDYFRRLGEWEAENERLEEERHRARTMAERLEYSLLLTRTHGPFLREDPVEDSAKVEFYERARRLGLLIR
jgi:hypothetical protein